MRGSHLELKRSASSKKVTRVILVREIFKKLAQTISRRAARIVLLRLRKCTMYDLALNGFATFKSTEVELTMNKYFLRLYH